MKNWFKRGLFALVLFVIVALVGAAVFLLTFDPNAYKNKVEQLVYERYQRHLKIDGDIELSLFPRIGLSVEQVSLSQRQSEEPFAAMQSARLAVAVWPLLWNRLVVDHVAVNGVRVWLERDQQGEFNFIDLLQKNSPAPTTQANVNLVPLANAQAQSASLIPDANQAEFQIDIAGLDLQEGEIHFFDQSSQTQMRLVNLELNTGRMTFGQPFDVIFKGALQGDKPSADAKLQGQAVVSLEPHLKRYAAQRIHLSLVGQVGAYEARSATLRGGLELLSLTEDLRARQLEILSQGRWQDDETTLNKVQLQLNAAQLNLKRNLSIVDAQKLQLRLNGLLPVTEGQAEHKVELALDAPRLNIQPEQVQGEPISLSFKQQQGTTMFGVNGRVSDLNGPLSQLELGRVQLDVARKTNEAAWKMDARAAARWEQDTTRLSWQDVVANLHVDHEGLDPNPANAKLTAQGDWVWAEKKGQLKGLWQSANTQAHFDSTLEHKKNWQLGVAIEAQGVDLNPWLPSAERTAARRNPAEVKSSQSARMLPDYIHWDEMEVQLKLSADRFRYQHAELEQLQLQAEQKERVVQLKTLQAKVFDGAVSGSAKWLHESAQAELALQLKDIDLAPYTQLLTQQKWLTGKGDSQLKLSTQGRSALARRAALTGTMQLKAKNGHVVGWDMWQHVHDANEAVRNVFGGQIVLPVQQYTAELSTPFKSLDYQLQFNQGQGQVQKLQWQAEGFKLSAEPHSYVDAVNQQMDWGLRIDLQKRQLPADHADLAVYAEHPLFIRLSGPWSAPFYRLQWQRLAHPVVQQAVDSGLLELLRTKRGSVIGVETKTDPAPPANNPKTLGNTLKDLLQNK